MRMTGDASDEWQAKLGCMMDIESEGSSGGAVVAPPAAAGVKGAVLRGPAIADIKRDELLAEIFAATVALTPDAACMVAGDIRLTYAEVDDKATAMARGLLREIGRAHV